MVRGYLSLFSPRPSQKTEPQSFHLFFSSQTLITCFGIPPWSHGIWFTTDRKITIDHKTSRLNFHFPLSLSIESESRVQREMVKTSTPQGCPLFFDWLIPLLHRPRGPSLPSLRTLPWPSPPEPVDQGWPGYPSLQEQWLPPSYLMILNLVVEARIEDTFIKKEVT